MENLLDTLKRRRDALVERGGELAGATRDRGLEALGKVRSGALDWHETIAARRSSLEEQGPKWFRLTGLQLVMLDRFDRVLLAFGERVRAEIQRLSRLELAASTPEEEAAPKTNGASRKLGETAEAKASGADASPAKTTGGKAGPKKSAAKAAGAKKSSTKSPKKPSKKTAAKASAKKASKTGASGAKKAAPTAKKTAKKAPKAKSNGKASRRLVMPIADYDALNAKEVLAELPRLSEAQCTTIFEHEKAHKKRKTVLRALEARMAS